MRAAFAALPLLAACSTLVEPVSTSSTRLQAVSPTTLEGVVGAPVFPAPAVIATDAAGRALRDALLSVEITRGNGTAGSTWIKTDRFGRATVSWTLGTRAGAQSLTLRNDRASPLTFNATAGPDRVASIRVEGAGQVGPPDSTLPEPLTALVADRFGNAIAAAEVTFSVLAGGGSIDDAPRFTDDYGVARSGAWRLGPDVGIQRIRVRSGTVETLATARTYGCWETAAGICTAPIEFAFVRRTDGQIYRMRTDGSGRLALTTGGANGSPAWSPDRSRIAFIHNDDVFGSAQADVWLMNADGSNPVQLTRNGAYGSVAWSPDGTRLAVSDDGLYSSSMSVIDATDANTRWFTVQQARSPAWSPDGTTIAFVRPSGDDGFEMVWLIDADGTRERQLTAQGSFIRSRIAWSPDGSEIIYADGGVLRAVKADGSATRTIVADDQVDVVQVSPDGKWLGIATEHAYPAPPFVGFMPFAGGEITTLVNDASDMAWRP